MTELTFFVPGVPKGKGRPRFSRQSGRAYTPAQTAAYESAVAYAGHAAMNGRTLLDGPVGVKMTAVFGIPASWSKARKASALHHISKPDADNIAKCCDALNGIVWKDDAQVARISVSKVYGETPGLHVFVEALA